mgnify:FL=1
MVQLIDSVQDIADQFDAIVFDQWGVLHNGQSALPGALHALQRLRKHRAKLAVLSNSGKRAAPNAARIAAKGFDITQFDTIMTSGEALWRKFAADENQAYKVIPIEGAVGDATVWADGLALTVTSQTSDADAILLMGLPDGTAPEDYDTVLMAGRDNDLPLYCSNPDLKSPRGHATYVMSPGVLAQRYRDMGGTTHLFGKPHPEIFSALQAALSCEPGKILMVGDSLHHDIKGANTAGWGSLLICSGIHAPDIGVDTMTDDIIQLAASAHTAPPTFFLPDLR